MLKIFSVAVAVCLLSGSIAHAAIDELAPVMSPQNTQKQMIEERIRQIEFNIFEAQVLIQADRSALLIKPDDNYRIRNKISDHENFIASQKAVIEKLRQSEPKDQ